MGSYSAVISACSSVSFLNPVLSLLIDSVSYFICFFLPWVNWCLYLTSTVHINNFKLCLYYLFILSHKYIVLFWITKFLIWQSGCIFNLLVDNLTLINRLWSRYYKDIQKRKNNSIVIINLSPLFSYYRIKFRIYFHSYNFYYNLIKILIYYNLIIVKVFQN